MRIKPLPVITPAATNGYYAMSNKTGGAQWSQEIKAAGDVLNGAIDYVGGFYFFKESNHTDAADVVLSSVIADRNIKTTNRSIAAYLQTDLHVTQNFMTTVGVRYTNEKKKLALADNRNAGAPISAGVARPDLRFTTSNLIAAGLPDRVKTKSLSPHVALSYTVAEI